MSDSFVHLHVHSDYSLLQAPISLDGLLQKAKEHGMHSVALTDIDCLSGIIPFYQKALAKGIKPIIGCEIHIAPESRLDKSGGMRASGSPIVLLARNNEGYHNLIRIATDAALNGFYYRPRTDKDFLREHAQGLIALSGTRFCEIQNHLFNKQVEKAHEAVKNFQSIFGEDNFYLELVNHGSERQETMILELEELSQSCGAPTVVTNDVFTLNPDDVEAMVVMQCIGNGKTIQDARRGEGTLLHFATSSAMRKKFSHNSTACDNTVLISERCNVELNFDEKHMPTFILTENVPPASTLRQLVEKGLNEKFQSITDEIRDRINHELSVIEQLGFPSYFLIVWDFIRYAREQKIPVGPGRGSCVGSLVAYCLGITEINPLDYDLLFERFLNPDRIGDPDIDIDICREGREQIIDYVRQKYGQESVAQIATFGTLGAKAVVRDVGRVLDIPLSDIDKIAKAIPDGLKMTLKRAWDESPELQQIIESDGAYRQLWALSKKLEGLNRHISIHAAAVVIADAPLTNYIPLTKSRDAVITQYNMEDVDNCGILKMDFLGLKTLTIIDKTINYLNDHNVDLNLHHIPLDDANTYDMLQKGESRNTFQYESAGMRELMVKMKPDRFEDLIATIALYRPGPLNSGMVDEYVQRKHGQQQFTYPHPSLQPILEDTYGVIIFQEQVMLIANQIAGFSLSEADHLRKAMAKKKPELMQSFREKFYKGAEKNDISKDIYTELFNHIEKFAEYGFNKSHSAGYALISYWTCYLKANHPGAYMSAVMSCDASNSDKIAETIAECRRMNIRIQPPDINLSKAGFALDDENTIRFGLEAVKGVGHKAIESIIHVREQDGDFKNFYDFCFRIDSRIVNKSVIEALIKSGAFDNLPGHRAQFTAAIEPMLKITSRAHSDKNIGQGNLFDEIDPSEDPGSDLMTDVPQWSEAQALAFEREVVGFYLSNHPLNQHEQRLNACTSTNFRDLKDFEKGSHITVGGLVTSVKPLITKKGRNPGKKMCAFEIEDLYGQAQAIAFPDAFEKSGNCIKADSVICINGKLDFDRDLPKIIVEKAYPLSQATPKKRSHPKSKNIKELVIRFTEDSLDDTVMTQIKSVLKKHQGQAPVVIEVTDHQGDKHRITASKELSVELNDDLRQEMALFLKEDQFRLQTLVNH